MQYFLKLA